ncbi:sulfatase family protein [Marinilabilia rubra]|uniref:Sulfatase N-terminal domain-containing protein n=1 Tax=Marinilabilia rubra TaxID=2162893 RepID=A0A2U2BBZ4_9BACT|nr:sulfatase-like hydrolase/transferase [Marinilabilia rubra]PWE00594.1 hypothetical protein DDZ16_03065 [Marinilabilia rubra]
MWKRISNMKSGRLMTLNPVIGILIIFLLALNSRAVYAQNNKQPNVLFIISDQWSPKISDGSGNYSTGIRTPNIDKLAEQGMRFTKSYCNFPLCTPARASIYTGLYPHNHGMIDNEEIFKIFLDKYPNRHDISTMGEVFKKAGYETAYIGKEHAGDYAYRGIDHYGSYKMSAGGMLGEGSGYDPVFTTDAINFIKREHNKPFFMTLSLINPHDICKVLGGKVKGATFADALFFCRTDDELYLRYQERPDVPENFDKPFIPGMINENSYMFEDLGDWDENEWRRYISTYCLLVENTDRLIGYVIDALEDAGLTENTIVVFTSDHGEMMGGHQLISKNILYEESVRTPFILRYPEKVKAGSVDDKTIFGSIDIMPTLLDLCDVSVPENMDGKSFKSRCLGGTDGEFEYLFSQIHEGRMLRFGDFKYVRSIYKVEQFDVLIDLKNDPKETQNVFMKPGYEATSKFASKKLDKWLSVEKLEVTTSRDFMNLPIKNK